MKVELKKISVSKSVIDQVKFARQEDILKQREVLGFCQWKMGSGKMMRRKNLFLFFTEDGDVRKFIDFDKAELNESYVQRNEYLTRNNISSPRIENPFRVIVRRQGFTESEYRFDTIEDAKELIKMLRVLKNSSIEQGQFFY